MSRRERFWASLAWAILIFFALLYVCLWAQNNRPEFDLLDLLPENQVVSVEEKWLQQALSKEHKDTVTLGIALPDEKEETLNSVRAVVDAWSKRAALFEKLEETAVGLPLLDQVRSLAQGQMTVQSQKELSATNPQAIFELVAANAASPMDASVFSFSEDPLGVQNEWIRQRLNQWHVHFKDGVLLTEHENTPYALYFFRLDSEKIMHEGAAVLEAIDELKHSLKHDCQASLIVSGLPLFSAAAAVEAQNELAYLGLLSTLGIIAIAWFWFGNLKALLLILAVSAQAFLLAVAATLLILGKVHLITLVFGTTLIGITVDYSAHYLCTRLGQSDSSEESLKALLPSLTLALLSTALGFALMASTPFPGLTQIAVFCVTGVASAYAAVVLWLPLLASGSFPFRKRLQKLTAELLSLPAFETLSKRTLAAIAALFIVLCTAGFVKLELKTSLYDLNNPPEDLLRQAATLSQVMNTPSLSQYFLIEASNPEELLQKEERLIERFNQLSDKEVRLISAADWIMSEKRAQEARQAYRSSCLSVSELFNNLLGAPLGCELASNPFNERLKIAESLNALPPLRLTDDKASALVLIAGIHKDNLDRIKALEDPADGVYFKNYPQQISELLARYCERIAWLLTAAALGTVILLTIRFKNQAWRAYCPCLCGIALTMATLGLLGYGLSLFSLLACVLLLGLGLDYGIFLTANPQGNSRTVAAVTFAVLTTLLSFGLLAFSSTPALNSFGLCIMIGEFFIWCLTPAFRKVTHRDETSSR